MQKIFLTLAAVCLSLNCLVAPAFAADSSMDAWCMHSRVNYAVEVGISDSFGNVSVCACLYCKDCSVFELVSSNVISLYDDVINGELLDDLQSMNGGSFTLNGISVPFDETLGFAWSSIEEEFAFGSPVDVYDLNGQLFLYSDEYDVYYPVVFMAGALPNSDVSVRFLADSSPDAFFENTSIIDGLNSEFGYDFTLDSPLSHVYLAIMGVEADVVFTFHTSESSVISVVSEVFTAAIGWAGTVAGTVASQPLLLMGVVLGFLGIGVSLFRRSSVA